MSQIYSLDTENEGVKLNKELEKKAAFKCGTFGASSFRERHLATGNFEGYLQLWDLQRPEKPLMDVKARTRSSTPSTAPGVRGAATAPNSSPAAATGARVWDVRQKDAPVAIFEPAEGVKARDCGASHSATPSTTKAVRARRVRQWRREMFDLRPGRSESSTT